MYSSPSRRVFFTLFLMLTHVACGDSDPDNSDSHLTLDGGTGGGDGPDAGPRQDAANGDAALRPGEVTFTQLYEEVLNADLSCGSLYCHGGGGEGVTMTGLRTTEKDALYDLLVNKDASANCAGWKRVVPGDPDKSLLLQKLGAAPPCGVRMPKDMAALPAKQVAQIRSWILDGAKNN